MKKKISVDETILLFCAFRWSINHNLYTETIANKLIGIAHKMDKVEREKYVKEIEKEIVKVIIWEDVKKVLMEEKSKSTKYKENINDTYHILYCSFKYALGRHTYVVGSIARTLIDSYGILNDFERERYVKDIDGWFNTDRKDARYHNFDTTKWFKVRALFYKPNRIMVKAYFPLKQEIITLKYGDPNPPVEINKKKKPEIRKAVVFEGIYNDSVVEYWNENMTAPFYYAEPIQGCNWD